MTSAPENKVPTAGKAQMKKRFYCDLMFESLYLDKCHSIQCRTNSTQSECSSAENGPFNPFEGQINTMI